MAEETKGFGAYLYESAMRPAPSPVRYPCAYRDLYARICEVLQVEEHLLSEEQAKEVTGKVLDLFE